MTDSTTIPEFVELFLSSRFHRLVPAVLSKESAEIAQSHPAFAQFWLAPPEMIAGAPDENGEAPWHPVPSPIDQELTSAFERFLGTSLPTLFKEYLCY